MILKDSIINYFPEGYVPHEHQLNVLQKIEESIKSGNKFIIIQAPTGSGKSFFSKTLANITSEASARFKQLVSNYDAYSPTYKDTFTGEPSHGAFVLTTTKTLQDQYKKLFRDGTVFKGKSNYQCSVDDECTVDCAPCIISYNLMKKCWSEGVCPYYESRNDCLINKFSVLNYSAFLNLPGYLKKREIIVCDECSELEDEIVKDFSVEIVYKQLQYLSIDIEKLKTDDIKTALGWLGDLAVCIEVSIDSHTDRQRFEKNKIEVVKQQQRKELFESVKNVINHWGDAQYIIEKDNDKVTITPLKVDKLTYHIFDYAEVVILMSATIVDCKVFAKNLGIEKYSYIEVPSTFDAKKSPVYCHNKYPLSYKTLSVNLPKVIDLIEQIAENHKNEKGIIHTHTFNITQEIQKRLKNKRFLYREEGTTNEEIVLQHTLRKDSTVLVSPSLTFGLDLKGELGKWQVIVKLPYLSLANKRTKILFESEPDWYRGKMLTTLVQAAGRCTRSKDDSCITYILDGLSGKVLIENTHILPRHFVDRIV